MLRAEALLQLGHKGEALAELDRLPLAQMPNSDEHHLVRGELRAAVGRWNEARRPRRLAKRLATSCLSTNGRALW